jgi:hypothetical protein
MRPPHLIILGRPGYFTCKSSESHSLEYKRVDGMGFRCLEGDDNTRRQDREAIPDGECDDRRFKAESQEHNKNKSR